MKWLKRRRTKRATTARLSLARELDCACRMRSMHDVSAILISSKWFFLVKDKNGFGQILVIRPESTGVYGYIFKPTRKVVVRDNITYLNFMGGLLVSEGENYYIVDPYDTSDISDSIDEDNMVAAMNLCSTGANFC